MILQAWFKATRYRFMMLVKCETFMSWAIICMFFIPTAVLSESNTHTHTRATLLQSCSPRSPSWALEQNMSERGSDVRNMGGGNRDGGSWAMRDGRRWIFERGSGWKREDGGREKHYGVILTSSIMSKGTGRPSPPLSVDYWLIVYRSLGSLSLWRHPINTHTLHRTVDCTPSNTVQLHMTLLKVIENESCNVCILNGHAKINTCLINIYIDVKD